MENFFSKATRKKMAPRSLVIRPVHLPAPPQVCKSIEKLMKNCSLHGNGAENGNRGGSRKAQGWQEWIKDEIYLKMLRGKAHSGDAGAMYRLGRHYSHGQRGLEKNFAEAYVWFKKAADANNTCAMAIAGQLLATGRGVDANTVEGIALLSAAAYHDGGSDFATFLLGKWYKEGSHGLCESKDRAQFYLRKTIDGSCKHKHMKGRQYEEARQMLDELANAEAAPAK